MLNRKRSLLLATSLALLFFAMQHAAWAAAAAGGGMPYSSFLGTFKTSITGEIAAIVCVVAIVAGVATYIFASAFDGILLAIVRVAIGATIIGSAVTMLSTMGVTGAVVGAHMEYINPPQDVQDAVAAVVHACAGWAPTEVQNQNPPHASSAPLESQVCGFIHDPAFPLWVVFYTTMGLTTLLSCAVFMSGLYRLPGWLLFLAASGLRRCWRAVM